MQHSRRCLSFIVTVAMIGTVERNFAFAQTEAPSQTPVVRATPGPQPPSAALAPYKSTTGIADPQRMKRPRAGKRGPAAEG